MAAAIVPIVFEILKAANIAIPVIANFITIFHHEDGSVTVISELDARSKASADVKAAWAKWTAETGTPAAPAT